MYLADPSSFVATFFFLMFCHFLADFPLQGDFLAKSKHPDLNPAGIWVITMTAHCMIHAGLTYALTGGIMLAMIQLVSHFVIDVSKCKGWLGLGEKAFVRDQLMHVLVMALIAKLYVFQSVG